MGRRVARGDGGLAGSAVTKIGGSARGGADGNAGGSRREPWRR